MRGEDFGPLAAMVLKHGFMPTQRAMICLASAAILVAETGEEPTVDALVEFWTGTSKRTTFRELAAWREVTGGADLGEAARRVAAEYQAELLKRENVEALTFDVARFVPAV